MFTQQAGRNGPGRVTGRDATRICPLAVLPGRLCSLSFHKGCWVYARSKDDTVIWFFVLRFIRDRASITVYSFNYYRRSLCPFYGVRLIKVITASTADIISRMRVHDRGKTPYFVVERLWWDVSRMGLHPVWISSNDSISAILFFFSFLETLYFCTRRNDRPSISILFDSMISLSYLILSLPLSFHAIHWKIQRRYRRPPFRRIKEFFLDRLRVTDRREK